MSGFLPLRPGLWWMRRWHLPGKLITLGVLMAGALATPRVWGLIVGALLLAVLGVRAVPVVIVLYIATSVVRWLSMKAKGCGQAG